MEENEKIKWYEKYVIAKNHDFELWISTVALKLQFQIHHFI